jgi:membrane protein implicated in regulation of membrane protease activity
MLLTAPILIFALLAVLFLFAAARRLRRRRVVGGLLTGTTALVFLLFAVCAGLIAANLRTYERLTHEQSAGELQLTRMSNREFNAVLTYPNGQHAEFELRGDEWQIDARVLKWRPFANLLGVDAAYRLERIGGRYTKVADEVSEAHTAYDLNPPQQVDFWELVHRYRGWVPWIDALYGSATFLPMADGALYDIKVSQSGLVSRPLNQAARDAVGNWH